MNCFKNIAFLIKDWKQDRRFSGSNTCGSILGQTKMLFNQIPTEIEADGQFPTLSSRRPWVKAGSVLALAGYIGQLACQSLIYPLLWSGSLWAVQAHPAGAMEEETPYIFKHSDRMTDGVITKIFSYSEDEKTLGRVSQVSWRWYGLVATLDRQALAFDREREELIGRILETTNAELSPIAIARRNPKLLPIHHLLTEPETLLIATEERNFLLASDRTTGHPFFGGIIERERRLAANNSCPGSVLSQYRHYRERCITLQGDALSRHITPKAILYIDEQRIYRVESSLAYKINSINEYNISQRENDAGNHAVCALGNPRRSVHFKNNNCHTDLSPAMESAMYGFYSLIAPNSVTPSFFMRIEGLPIKKPSRQDLMAEWNAVERGDQTFASFINDHAEEQAGLFITKPQNFILQGSRTAEGMRLDHFLAQVQQGQASYEAINRESFSYHILLSLLFNPSDYKADNLFLSPEGHIVGIDNDGCLAHLIVHIGTRQKECHVGIKNVLYLLPLMEEAIPENVITTFASLNIPLTLLRWASFLDAQDKKYKSTFDPQGVERPIEDGHNFPVRLVPGTMATLYGALHDLQKILTDSQGITHQQLLMKLQPLVGEAYQAHLGHNPDPLTAMSVIYGRTVDLQALLPHLASDLQKEARSKDDYTQERKAFLQDEIQAMLPKLQGDRHFSKVLRFILHCFPQNTSQFLPLLLKSIDFSREDPATLSLFIKKWRTFLPGQINGLTQYLSRVYTHTHFLFRMVGSWADIDTVSFLLDSGLDVCLYDAENKTILHHAVEHQCPPELLPVLFAKVPTETMQGFLSHEDNHRRTPLDYALEKRYIHHFVYLLNQGAKDCSATCALRFYQNYVLKNFDSPILTESFISLMDQNPEVEWWVALSHMLPPASSKIEGIKAQSSSYGYVKIPTSIQKQITNKNGELIPRNNKYGNHRVAQAFKKPDDLSSGQGQEHNRQPLTVSSCLMPHQLYFKLYPAWPEMEEAVGRLTRSIIGFGAPHTDLIKINGLPVLVSQGIRGETLAEVLQNPKKRHMLNKLDFESVSAMILMAMLVNPEDGKPENYIVESHPYRRGKYRLVCVDNDQAFVPAFVCDKPLEGGLFTKAPPTVQVKTILYCLDEMKQPVSPTARDRFLSLNPYEVLKRWLESLKRVDGAYGIDDENAGLLSLTEQVNFFKNEEKDEKSFIGLVFPDGAMARLYEKFIRLQECLHKTPAITHIDLLAKLEPLLVKRYRTALGMPQSVLTRFKVVDAQFYGKSKSGSYTTLNSSQDIMLSSDIPINVDIFENIKSARDLEMAKEELKRIKNSHGVIAACQQLEKVHQEINDQKIEELIKKSKNLSDLASLSVNRNKMKFLKKLDFKSKPTTYQQTVLNFLKMNTHLPKIQLKNMVVVDNKWLLPKLEVCLFGYLTHLNLAGCINITQDILPELAQNHPNLEVLNLSNLPKLRWIANADLFNYHPITFGNLRKLNLNNCTALEAIDVDAPNLKNLWANGVKKLGALKMKAAINDDVFYDLLQTLNVRNFRSFQVDFTNCPNITAVGRQILSAIWNPGVKSLDLSDNQLGSSGVSVLATKTNVETATIDCQDLEHFWTQQGNIKTVQVRGDITDEELYKILLFPTKLKNIDLANCSNITVEGRRVLSSIFDPRFEALFADPTCSTLNLHKKNIKDSDIIALTSALSILGQVIVLTSLNLGSNQIGDMGAQALALSVHLTKLNLEHNEIGDIGVQALARNTTLLEMNLGWNKIGTAGVKALAENNTLKALELDDTAQHYFLRYTPYKYHILQNQDKIGNHILYALLETKKLDEIDLTPYPKLTETGEKILQVFRNPSITSLDLSNNKIGDVEVQVLAGNISLTSLNLRWNEIGDMGAQALAANTTLMKLDLWKNQIKDAGAQVLANNNTLTSLNLGMNQIGSAGGQALAANATLMELDLSTNNIEDLGAQALARNTTLTSLNLTWNHLSDAGVQALAGNITLTSLNLQGNQIGSVGAQALADNTSLTSLYLVWNEIGATIAQILAGNNTLKSLYLMGNKIGDLGAQALARNATLTKLDLSDNKIGDLGAQALAANAALTELNLSRNKIGDLGAQALARNTTLRELNLWGSQISDAGAQSLALSTTLTTLDLSHNRIGDAGAQSLALSTTLIWLYLEGNSIGSKGKSALRSSANSNLLSFNPGNYEIQ